MMIKEYTNNSTPKAGKLLPSLSSIPAGVAHKKDDNMKQNKYKLSAVNHDGSEVIEITTDDSLPFLMQWAKDYTVDKLIAEFSEKVNWLNGDSIDLFIELNDGVIRDVAPYVQFIQTKYDVLKGINNRALPEVK